MPLLPRVNFDVPSSEGQIKKEKLDTFMANAQLIAEGKRKKGDGARIQKINTMTKNAQLIAEGKR